MYNIINERTYISLEYSNIQIPNLLCALYFESSKHIRQIILDVHGLPISIINSFISKYDYIKNHVAKNDDVTRLLYGDNIIIIPSHSKKFKILDLETKQEIPYQIINNKNLTNVNLSDIIINEHILLDYITTFQIINNITTYDFS